MRSIVDLKQSGIFLVEVDILFIRHILFSNKIGILNLNRYESKRKKCVYSLEKKSCSYIYFLDIYTF